MGDKFFKNTAEGGCFEIMQSILISVFILLTWKHSYLLSFWYAVNGVWLGKGISGWFCYQLHSREHIRQIISEEVNLLTVISDAINIKKGTP